MPEDSQYSFRYRCAICEELIRPEDVGEHWTEERLKPDWPGHLEWKRVDDPKDPKRRVV